MIPKIHSKLTFTKVTLLLVFVCAFLIVRFGSFKEQKANHQARAVAVQTVPTVQTAKVAPIIEAPKPEALKIETTPKKRFTVQKRTHHKASQAKAKEAALGKLVESELAAFDETTDALDIHGPIEDLISYGFKENLSGSESFFASSVEKRHEKGVPEKVPALYTKEGLFKKNNFDEIKRALEAIKEQETEINKSVAKQEEKNILVVKKDPNRQLATSGLKISENTVRDLEIEPPQTAPLNTNGGSLPSPKEQEGDDVDEDEPTLATPQKRKFDLSPVEASMGTGMLSRQKSVSSQGSLATQSAVTTQNVPDADPDQKSTKTDKLNGVLYVDSSLDQWLVSNKGHIELNMHRYASRNTEDLIRLDDYRYPEREFDYDTSKLEGKYQLVAEVYSGSAKAPYLQITYPKILTAENFGEKVAFYLKMQGGNRPPHETPVLNVTIFEAAGGNYRQAKGIEGAEIYIVGLESLGRFRTDKDGNARIANIPLHSELLMDVSAAGFYPTRKTVPVTTTSAYATVNLIEKQKVETVTTFFTRKAQDAKKAVVFGRVYNSESRKPQAEDEVYLSNRKGHALYFNALPDTRLTSSTETGLFAFMNVEPAFRAVFRSKSDHAIPMQLLPGYGYYADLGRGGKKSIRAVVTDPVQKQVVHGLAATIGSDKNQVESDESGKFEIMNVDLPTGNVTVEFRAKDYPVTWYTLPWDTREATKTKNLYILERELIYESAMSFARIRPEKHKGILIGGAEEAFFKGNNRCVHVELLNYNGKVLEEENGPYLLYQRSNPRDNPCLTKTSPGFAFYNLVAGEYILNWKNNSGKFLSSQVVRIGTDRLSVVVR